jgi:Tfp pilus assembly pilus retraction ATPase PilT
MNRIQEIQLELKLLKSNIIEANKILETHRQNLDTIKQNIFSKIFEFDLALQLHYINNDSYTQKQIIKRSEYQINSYIKELEKIGTPEALLTIILN